MIDGGFSNRFDEDIHNFIPKIMVMGVGGAGCNAVNSMIANGIDGVDFIVANTDGQSLSQSKASKKLQLGKQTTRGFGAGSKPEVGRKAAEESADEISNVIKNSNILFLTAGMGGGTGSGALPVIAALAKEKGILTVAIVTTPFDFEGKKKADIANDAIENLIGCVDSYIVLPNQNLYNVVDNQISSNAFKYSDNMLYEAIRSITDLINIPGIINLDFADICAVLQSSGRTIIGTAVKEGEARSIKAVEGVLLNPMLRGNDIKGARSVLVNITANPDNLSLDEFNEVMNTLRIGIDSDEVDLFLGTCYDKSMGESLKVSIIVTGLLKNQDTNTSYFDKINLMNATDIIDNQKIEDRVDVKPLSFDNDIFDKEPSVGIEKLDIETFGLDEKIETTLSDFIETEDKKEENNFDDFLNVTSSSIDDFINNEAEKISKSLNENNLDEGTDGDDDPNGNGKKKNSLSSFLDLLDSEKDDTFFSDVDDLHNDKMSLNDDINISAVNNVNKKEEGNVVFLAGSLDDQKSDTQQTDLMEVTLELPTMFRKK